MNGGMIVICSGSVASGQLHIPSGIQPIWFCGNISPPFTPVSSGPANPQAFVPSGTICSNALGTTYHCGNCGKDYPVIHVPCGSIFLGCPHCHAYQNQSPKAVPHNPVVGCEKPTPKRNPFYDKYEDWR